MAKVGGVVGERIWQKQTNTKFEQNLAKKISMSLMIFYTKNQRLSTTTKLIVNDTNWHSTQRYDIIMCICNEVHKLAKNAKTLQLM